MTGSEAPARARNASLPTTSPGGSWRHARSPTRARRRILHPAHPASRPGFRSDSGLSPPSLPSAMALALRGAGRCIRREPARRFARPDLTSPAGFCRGTPPGERVGAAAQPLGVAAEARACSSAVPLQGEPGDRRHRVPHLARARPGDEPAGGHVRKARAHATACPPRELDDSYAQRRQRRELLPGPRLSGREGGAILLAG